MDNKKIEEMGLMDKVSLLGEFSVVKALDKLGVHPVSDHVEVDGKIYFYDDVAKAVDNIVEDGRELDLRDWMENLDGDEEFPGILGFLAKEGGVHKTDWATISVKKVGVGKAHCVTVSVTPEGGLRMTGSATVQVGEFRDLVREFVETNKRKGE